MVDIKSISTEQRNKSTKHMDVATTQEILKMINEEDKKVPEAIEAVLEDITKVVDAVTIALSKGGRLFYIGAGTSGRLGVLDASECVPTFGVPENMVIGIIAGGDKALRNAVEGAEDNKEAAIEDLKSYNLTKKDFVIGIAASGRTPYVVSGLEYAKSIGAKTGSITTSVNAPITKIADYPIAAITGPEPLTGSTRMKSGTAQKLILNMISTTAMVKLGKVYENLMIDIQMSNDKLVSRAISIVCEVTGVEEKTAVAYLERFKSVKHAVISILGKIDEVEMIDELLRQNNGNIKEALRSLKA
ncbi:N-acetylmuramic acid 6-phosphate etherase [Acholeplasma equirhinis]|uniref:N-acetylmuramic acid 6-phosphate etherase n=1 Tax=Acholeplasma equirhinis TaxID=555393 RepID=UPI00197AE685|nr:N-acetylmuramic acid 6-phosphate etherase [Acholeplasma equirhinis]MBN3490758.1 N-acetylmuramic acid 6-phosphate etherase [Acholeplasma equirhinis]